MHIPSTTHSLIRPQKHPLTLMCVHKNKTYNIFLFSFKKKGKIKRNIKKKREEFKLNIYGILIFLLGKLVKRVVAEWRIVGGEQWGGSGW